MIWRACLMIAGLALGAVTARAGDNAVMPQLPEIAFDLFTTTHLRPGVLTIDLRNGTTIGATEIASARHPQEIAQSEISADCLAVMIIDETSRATEVADAIDRFGGAGCEIRRLAQNVSASVASSLPRAGELRQILRPGEVPFIIPRGLCDSSEPVQTFN